ncbi:MAG: YtfJ family protein [Alistipes sp.]|nr:YtfJ family protein [Alistipes sp.]
MYKYFISLAATIAVSIPAFAANPDDLPRKVENIEIVDLNGNPAKLPMWGEKNLMIFYVDPDHHKQNQDFTDDMEANHRVEGDNIYGLGVMNLKDAPMVPNGVARSMARKRTEKNGATVLADQERVLSTQWGLGDCNNKFVLLLVSKDGEIVFMRKGELSQSDIAEFYRVVEKYK